MLSVALKAILLGEDIVVLVYSVFERVFALIKMIQFSVS